MNGRLLTHLRHVDLAVPDYEKQLDFYGGVWGLTKVSEDSGISFLAAEGSPRTTSCGCARPRRSASTSSPTARPTRSPSTRSPSASSRAACSWCPGPGTWTHPVAATVSASSTWTAAPSRSPPTSRCAGDRKIEEKEAIPVKLSHVVLNSPDLNRTREWYERHLGFALSDTLSSPHMGEVMHFMRISNQHHSMAIAQGPHTALHHVSFEMRGIDEYMRGSGRVMRAGFKKVWGPGHMAGDNTFTYFLDPHGNTVEYTTELENLDEDTWHPHVYDFSQPEVTDQWGTANAMNEIVAKESFNDPDRGVFVAPPV